MENKEKCKRVLDILKKCFPDARSSLEFSTPLELLIATILSAQATDKLVNTVIAGLFEKFPTAVDYATAPLEDIEGAINRINFYRNKAKSIKACCKRLVEAYGGRVPDTLPALTTLAGVGRKTANVVLGNAFGKDALAVDTHVKRVAQRLGMTASDDPDKIEEDLCSLIPKARWTQTSHLFILHGRKTCKAKTPQCGVCPVNRWCEYYKTTFGNKEKHGRMG